MGLQESGPLSLEDPRGVGYHWSVLGTWGGPNNWDKLHFWAMSGSVYGTVNRARVERGGALGFPAW